MLALSVATVTGSNNRMSNDELEGMCKEVLVTEFSDILRNFPERIEQNHEKPQSGLVGVPDEIRTQYLPNASQKSCSVNR
jgi:hypothetical protein